MTKIIESILVEVRCAAEEPGLLPGTRRMCSRADVATIVSRTEGDLVLMPIDWQATTVRGQITVNCPRHNERK